MDDEKIIALYLCRDEAAIRETDIRYGKYCYSIARRILDDARDVDEIVSDTYLSAWNSIPPEIPKALSAFLGKITRNLSLKRRRDKRAEKRGGGEVELVFDELADCVRSDRNVEDEVEIKELTACIDRFLRALPMTERNVFLCRYWYFDSVGEIAEQFGFSQSKVKSLLFRTRKKLYRKLQEEEFV